MLRSRADCDSFRGETQPNMHKRNGAEAMDWTSLLAALGGGAFGAAIGALAAFIFCGVALLVGIAIALGGGGTTFVDAVALGPFFGPHVAFAGGVAGAAYAARRNQLADGKDIGFALAEIGKPGPLIVGGVFGAAGYLVVDLLGPTLAGRTDSIALTVVALGVISRMAFGRKGLFGSWPRRPSLRQRFASTAEEAWVPHQRHWSQAATLGVIAGLLASYATLEISASNPDLESVAVPTGFAVSAVSLVFAAIGIGVPVTHHMTLTSAVAASASGNLVIGGLVGAVAGVLGEFFARAVQNPGDTHIDPPANTIWSLTAVVFGVDALVTGL
ncbi:hypothetical protein [Jiangella asiatica]|uniref:DUF7973 domain-containing protein n=1 Tax=Jiangella asiatica TaxID=2530372 RepID=A0A4R5CJB8_9ACTN|nr:hypothetical protein [Jiangella asiatica]TDD99925.1 hypothetical protein E1269_27085 [Jiangella asiatica]